MEETRKGAGTLEETPLGVNLKNVYLLAIFAAGVFSKLQFVRLKFALLWILSTAVSIQLHTESVVQELTPLHRADRKLANRKAT